MVRRSVYGGDAALVALIAASSLVGIQSYSMSSLFGAKAPGLRAQNSFCQGPICKTPELVPSLRARGKHGLAPTMVAAQPKASATAADPIGDYCSARGGSRPIRKILIANNGMAATKSILSMRQWAYMELGDEKLIEFVAMATPEDLNANAEFIRLADSFVEVPAGGNKNNYANVDLIIKTAVENGVDAVWPGWGHASENPALPNGLDKAGIKFIGPRGPIMYALGDKIAANILAQTAGVPSIPWSGSFGGENDGPLTAELDEECGVDQEIFKKAQVFTVEEAVASAARIGYPVMLKASEGGGGKGIRMSASEEELLSNFVQVQNEVPGSPMFMMQLCTQARHLEVQIVGDEHGQAVALNGRDCSTQRRFQKIFEEGPPTIAKPDTFREMEKAAMRLTQSIGYSGAGTVEYLYQASTDTFAFLELNPRLQVEHPVTEGITGVNMPATQLQVAMGIPLHRIPQIRSMYGRDPYGEDKIDFQNDEYVPINRHVIAARITAENPDEGFKPTSGKIDRVKFQSSNNVWGYFSVGNNGGIHEFADSQFGHLFAVGPNREAARKSLVLSLKQLDVRGEIRNPVEYLTQLLETDDFKANNIDTSWLDGIIKNKSVKQNADTGTVVMSAAFFRAYKKIKAAITTLEESLKKGQTGVADIAGINKVSEEITYEGVKYAFEVTRSSPDRYTMTLNGKSTEIKFREQPDGSILASFGGAVRKVYGQEEPLGLRMIIDGSTIMLPNVFDPSELRSDVTGKVVRFLKEDGADFKAGEPFVECEAMKMIMQLKATQDGKVNHELAAGSIINAGDLIATVELDDPSKVVKIESFDGTLDIESGPSDQRPMHLLNLALKGYPGDVETQLNKALLDVTPEEASDSVAELIETFCDNEDKFKGKALDLAVLDLISQNKESTAPVIEAVQAHGALASRTALVMAVLRNINSFVDRFPGYEVPARVTAALERLSELPGASYGEVSTAAAAILSDFRMPDFSSRLAELETLITSDTPENVCKLPKLSLVVDFLSHFFSSSDKKIRDAALEVYVRRVYRMHTISDVTITETDGVVMAKWQYQLRDLPSSEAVLRFGMLTVLDSAADAAAKVPVALADFKAHMGQPAASGEPLNTFHVAFKDSTTVEDADAYAKKGEMVLKDNKAMLTELGVRHVNYIVPQGSKSPRYFTYLSCHDYDEEVLRRDMRASFPYILELTRLQGNYDLTRIPALGRNAQLWIGTEKPDDNVAVTRPRPQTVFLRALSHSLDSSSATGAERLMVSAMDELDRALLNPLVTGQKKLKTPYPVQYGAASTRIFLHVLNEYEADTQSVIKGFKGILDGLLAKYSTRLLQLRVDELEVKARISYVVDGKKHIQPIRLVASSTSGDWLKSDAYLEYPDPVTGVTKQFRSLEEAKAGVMQISPYPTANTVQMKRATARRVGSTYAFDFLGLMEVGLIKQWAKHPNMQMPTTGALVDAKELVLGADGKLQAQTRPVGSNKIGMLAWTVNMKTPEFPNGREVVIIANDVTVQSGSFGVEEDDFYFAASEYARERGLPRLYIACNSGARIGLIEELKPKFKVAWNDEADPAKGFKYLYLTEEDYNGLKPDTVQASKTTGPDGETRYAIDTIVGSDPKQYIGVENLRGSGKIAGETSRAYDEIFTLSFVTGRSVGIGAYIVRLGQRVIQMVDGPMILTGYGALNKLLGKEVYTSQDQLGGPQVMHPNGVTHQVVPNDQEGVNAMLDWLSFVPENAKEQPPVLPVSDPVERDVEFAPTKSAYDPRNMLAGAEGPDGKWISGFFDKDSFKETLAGWGKSVVTGRARLGGQPMGVIAVETRLMERRIPADPANPESREVVEAQAGQVWFPDSSYKTAQAIQDFNRGENLPLIIFANWRGFSGGTRDMYQEVLKFGSKIVDALRTYKHPVYVYIPPHGELRGGSWVVVDPTINEDMMEMYADQESRGGILEPPGICEVKFRKPDQIKTMHRLDEELIKLDAQLSNAGGEESVALKAQIAKREETLLPLYTQIAHEFADLHDRAGRMKAKGVVRDVLAWKRSREYFFWRVQRRQAEFKLRKAIVDADPNLTFAQVTDKMQSMAGSTNWEDDKAIADWLKSDADKISTTVSAMKADGVASSVEKMLSQLPADARADLVKRLR
jgi:acetyl-CoA carboxylase/biotin carboxylase 1